MKAFIAILLILGGSYGQGPPPQYLKSYYVFTAIKLNWYEAFYDCLSRNLQLATINSSDEQFAIERAMMDLSATAGQFWISATDQAREGRFVWMSTGRAVTYTNWNQGQPDNAGDSEHCVQIWNNVAFGTWNDVNCLNKMLYICEDTQMSNYIDVNVNVNTN